MYRFVYSPEVVERTRRDLYWCFDGQVVVRNGKLVDTYWGECGEARVVKPSEGTLTFVCNLNDTREIKEWERRYYRDEDVFNLSRQHGCYKYFAVLKETQRSAEKMLAWLDEESAAAKQEIRSRIATLERLATQRARVEAGDTSISIG